MFKYITLLILVLSIFFASCKPEVELPDPDEEDPTDTLTEYPAPLRDTVPAFPGAQGGAKFIMGGAGGDVYVVTKLEDSFSDGTLRSALGKFGKRTIVFAVAGVIELNYKLSITNGDVTIAGQTAPGDGICIKNFPMEINADNVIVRFMRFRMGDEKMTADDALMGRNRKNIMIDHCSMSWSTDECSSFYDNENFTMQWCYLTESLRNSVHGKGAHGYGGIWGGKMASFHHNLLAHHDSRNPRFCGSRYSNNASAEKVDFRYNVVYNWRSNSGYAGEGGSYNMVNNYYKPGPATYSRGSSNSVTYRIFQPNADDGTNKQLKGIYGRFYVAGNVMDNINASAPNVTANNWLGVHYTTSTLPELRVDTEFNLFSFTQKTATEAYNDVLTKGGASFPRDAVDTRIVNEVTSGTHTFTGSNGSTLGIIDSQTDVNGWPEYTFNADNVPLDTDKDGMPDAWEDEHGLNKNDKTDAKKYNLSPSYTNLEMYINSLVQHLY